MWFNQHQHQHQPTSVQLLPLTGAVVLSVIMVFSTWTITDRSYLNFLDNDNLTPDEDYFLRLRFHHRNLLALSWEEKAALAPSYEGQLVPLANHIVQLRRRPEFTAINQTADRLLRLQEEVVRDLQVAEARIGRLSSSQREFVTIQCKKNSLIELGKKRNREEDALLRRLQIKLMNSKRDMSDYDDRLLIKPKSSAKSGAEREAKSRATRGKKRDRSGAEREARRKRARTSDQVEKERADSRVGMVAHRAGGLSQSRKEDVRAGQRKNKDTAVFSGDALKTKEITEGNFIVEPLTGGRDGLGNLGDITCNFCGALK